MSHAIEVKVPDIGDYKDIPVIEVLIKAGDTVEKEQSLVTLESDKATMDVPSSASGVVKEVAVKVGDNVSEGVLVIVLEAAEGAAAGPASGEVRAREQGHATTEVPAAGAGSSGVMEQVKVPDIGDYKNIPVIEVAVKIGDRIEKEQTLVTLESDKATMDVPSSATGIVKDMKVKVGDTVSEGSVIVVLEAEAGTPVPTPAGAVNEVVASPAPVGPSARSQALVFQAGEDGTRHASHASPSVRKFARELGVELAQVQGTGSKGRVTQPDVAAFVKLSLSAPRSSLAAAAGVGLNLLPWPKVDFAKFGPVDPKPLSRIKKISGANLHRNWVMIPHVTNNDEADITELEALRVELNKENEKAGVKITMLSFVIKAAVSALKKFPTFNTSLDGDNLVFKQYYHIGFAADTSNGLVVPVIRDADRKGLVEIAREMAELSRLAREGKLKPEQMQGGCFSISSLGGIGGTNCTPIVNAPEVAILALSRGAMKAVWDGKQFVPRLMLPLSLSYDHRVIDGAEAARFNAHLGAILADFRRVIL
ncbi:dihydrolipoyllysine-residue acetyltransferase [Paraburkholderia sp.]|uniref:dihydrolipoyllysine-residue acetyltransferase n=1 Tax=Paraburkholderia sp. TaxID=1926495 RepID=UPI003C7A5B41